MTMTETKTRRTPAQLATYHKAQAEKHAHKARMATDPIYRDACRLQDHFVGITRADGSLADNLYDALDAFLGAKRPYDAPGVEKRAEPA
jgi:hypothetical protein